MTMEEIVAVRVALAAFSSEQLLTVGLEKLLAAAVEKNAVPVDHVEKTPERFNKAIRELMEGVVLDPRKILSTAFEETDYGDEMIVVRDIEFVSLCAHHLLPFIGKVHFAYIPDKKVVGLSKIPRLVECLSRRPQIQERLSSQIVDIFQDEIKPIGCGVKISANHLCMAIRGVRKPSAMTDTVALRGVFKSIATTKQEFLDLVRS